LLPDGGVVAAMAEDGIDSMGCDVEGVPRIDDDWGLPDPKGQSPERVREIRDMVKVKAQKLAQELIGRPAAAANNKTR
jgi:protein-tyrosine-phosphatase